MLENEVMRIQKFLKIPLTFAKEAGEFYYNKDIIP